MVGHEDGVRIKVMKLDAAAQLPRYAHTGPFGDLAADLFAVAGVTLGAGATAAVATGRGSRISGLSTPRLATGLAQGNIAPTIWSSRLVASVTCMLTASISAMAPAIP